MSAPPDLVELQKWMQQALVKPQQTQPQEIKDRVRSTSRLSAAAALEIYQNSYSLRIAACMRDQFPALCYALGEGLFNDFVAEYSRQAPPESYTLYDLGRRFAGFLQANRPDLGAPAPELWVDFIIDLARFERQIFSTFDCAGAEELHLAEPTTPDAELLAQPSLSVAAYGFPVGTYYHAVRQGLAPQPPEREQVYLAILRKDYVTHTIPVSFPHFVFLQEMCLGGTVATALAAVSQQLMQPLAKVGQAWSDTTEIRDRWITAGFFLDRRWA
ncbi:putative DNA-binding domain-containing protein [Pseudophaeobacter arcticus]|uniref:HvfC/BufC family peptide modification chaperone n=1 Tax=Pseudophaeobacter arcticus TaxID=385492 RepID=UPI0039E602B0